MRTTLHRNPENSIRASVKTPRMTMTIAGPLYSSIPEIFVMVGDRQRREAILEQMHQVHADMTQREGQLA
jgi:hypothetical protein